MDLTKAEKAFLISLGARIRDLRTANGWTLEETEEYGWPSWRHLQRVESGKNVNIVTLLRISALYGISLEELFKGL